MKESRSLTVRQILEGLRALGDAYESFSVSQKPFFCDAGEAANLVRGSEKLIAEVPLWRPVGEELPEEGKPESILLYLDYRDGCGGQAVGYFLGGEFWLYEDGNITCDEAGVDVTHWMPLPEPPSSGLLIP